MKSFNNGETMLQAACPPATNTTTAPGWNELPAIEPLTDLGNAQRLVRQHGLDLRYVPSLKKWLVWADGIWRLDHDGEVMRRAKQTIRKVYEEADVAEQTRNLQLAEKLRNHAERSQSVGRLRAMIDLAQSESGIPIEASMLDANPMLFGVANGVLDLTTGQLRPGARRDYITKRSIVHFDPSARCPRFEALRFEALLQEIFEGDQMLIDFMQRVIGYTLTGHTREQCVFYFHGRGANGKSTLTRAISNVMGDHAIQCPPETLMVKRNNGVSNDVARLAGSRLALSLEVENGQVLAEALIKQMTGQDKMAARYLYSEYTEFEPTFKVWIAANHRPVIRGQDDAIWRRIHLVPFDVTIPESERDRELPEKLRQEYSGILAFGVRGCLEWQRRGLNVPPQVRLVTQQFREEMDVLGQWIEHRCVTGEACQANATTLYESYKVWASPHGQVMTQTSFGREMRNRGFAKATSGKITYRGIGLKDISV